MMSNKILFILFVFLFMVKNKKGTVKVEPLINYNDFLNWYKNTIGDYNENGSIPFEKEYFALWLKKNKG